MEKTLTKPFETNRFFDGDAEQFTGPNYVCQKKEKSNDSSLFAKEYSTNFIIASSSNFDTEETAFRESRNNSKESNLLKNDKKSENNDKESSSGELDKSKDLHKITDHPSWNIISQYDSANNSFDSKTERMIEMALNKDKMVINDAKSIKSDVQNFLSLLKNVKKTEEHQSEESEKFVYIDEDTLEGIPGVGVSVSEFGLDLKREDDQAKKDKKEQSEPLSVIFSTNESITSSSPLSNRKKENESSNFPPTQQLSDLDRIKLSNISENLAKKNLQFIEYTFSLFLDKLKGPGDLRIWEEKLKAMQKGYLSHVYLLEEKLSFWENQNSQLTENVELLTKALESSREEIQTLVNHNKILLDGYSDRKSVVSESKNNEKRLQGQVESLRKENENLKGILMMVKKEYNQLEKLFEESESKTEGLGNYLVSFHHTFININQNLRDVIIKFQEKANRESPTLNKMIDKIMKETSKHIENFEKNNENKAISEKKSKIRAKSCGKNELDSIATVLFKTFDESSEPAITGKACRNRSISPHTTSCFEKKEMGESASEDNNTKHNTTKRTDEKENAKQIKNDPAVANRPAGNPEKSSKKSSGRNLDNSKKKQVSKTSKGTREKDQNFTSIRSSAEENGGRWEVEAGFRKIFLKNLRGKN